MEQFFFFFTKGKTLSVTALTALRSSAFFKPVIRVQNVFITCYLLVSAFTSKKTKPHIFKFTVVVPDLEYGFSTFSTIILGNVKC